MATWPSTLPQSPLLDSFGEQKGENRVVTEMESGPPKRRRRSTVRLDRFRFNMELTKAQLETFDTFYTFDLADGVLPFDFTHPRTKATIKVAFVTPPAVVPAGSSEAWLMAFELQQEP